MVRLPAFSKVHLAFLASTQSIALSILLISNSHCNFKQTIEATIHHGVNSTSLRLRGKNLDHNARIHLPLRESKGEIHRSDPISLESSSSFRGHILVAPIKEIRDGCGKRDTKQGKTTVLHKHTTVSAFDIIRFTVLKLGILIIESYT